MISTEDAEAIPPAASGSAAGFRRILTRSALAVAVIAALVYLSADSSDLDLTSITKVKDCPIHHRSLVVTRAPITYGESNDQVRDYYHATKVSFPHAGVTVFASDFDATEWPTAYRFARVWQCPECVRAEKQWAGVAEKAIAVVSNSH